MPLSTSQSPKRSIASPGSGPKGEAGNTEGGWPGGRMPEVRSKSDEKVKKNPLRPS